MQPLNIQETLLAISPARLTSYRNMFTPQSDYELYGVYCWNEAVSQCFHSLLSMVEVTLRNGLHRSFERAHLGLAQPPPVHWYEHLKLQPKSEQKVKKITHRWSGGNHIRRVPSPSADDVTASLTFGFWKHLLDSTHYIDNTPVNLAQILTWSFPHHSNTSVNYWSKLKWQDKLFSRLDLVADIRNRIAHLEPIWKFGDLLEETRPRAHTPQIVAQIAPTTPTECIARLILVLNRSIELLHWTSKHRARDFRESINNKKLRYLLTNNAIDYFKMCCGNSTVNLSGLYRMYKKNLPVDGILHLEDARMQKLIIMPWV